MLELLTDALGRPDTVIGALPAGAALGLMFYGGLWWTVHHLPTFRRPGPTMLASTVLRVGGALAGLFVVGGGDWARWLWCLLGFALGRAAVTWSTRHAGVAPAVPKTAEETHHAP